MVKSFCSFFIVFLSFSQNRSVAQKLYTSDIITIYNKSVGYVENYLSNKGFAFTKNGNETYITCTKVSWVPVITTNSGIVTKRYCGVNMEDEYPYNSYVEYVFKDLTHFNFLKSSLNSLGFKRVDTFENVDGLNVLYQKVNNPICKIQFTSKVDVSYPRGLFTVKYYRAELIFPYED